MQRVASVPLPRRGEVAAYVILSIALTWPALYVWSGCYCVDNNLLQPWPKDVAWAANFLPEAALAGALMVWAVFGRKIAVTVAGFGAAAGWIGMAFAITYVLPWKSFGHDVAAAPNLITTLLAFGCAVAISIACSRALSRLLGRPTIGLTVSLLLVPSVLLAGGSAYLNIRQSQLTAAFNRGQEVGQGCQRGEYPYDGRPHEPYRRCFDLAERTRKDASDTGTLALAREIYEWGCEYGETPSCVAAGAMYEKGDGIRADRQKAAELYAYGCAFSSQKECGELARVFDEAGDGARALMKASCKTVPTACLFLGRLYERGTGVPRSGSRALTLYDLACAAREEVGCYNASLYRSNSEKH